MSLHFIIETECRARVENQHHVYQCWSAICSAELHTKQGSLVLLLPISCLLLVTNAVDIKGLRMIIHLHKSWVHSTYYTTHLLWVVLSSPVAILRITGLQHDTEDTASSNWPGKQTSSHDGTGSPDLRIFSHRGLSLRHAKESRIFSSICTHQHKTRKNENLQPLPFSYS